MPSHVTIPSPEGQPWVKEREVLECECGIQFPHPPNSKSERQARSFHFNDCKVHQQHKRALEQEHQRIEEQVREGTLIDQLCEGDVFPEEQARRLVEVFAP